MTYGLLSALSWGVSTLLAAVAARRIGTLRTVVLGEAAGLVGYLTLFYLGHFSLRGVGSTAWLLILGGVIGVGGYLALYRGLESGHIGLVSAISACYGGVIAVLSVVLLHEHLTMAAAVGIMATVLGVMLTVMRRAGTPALRAPAAAEPIGDVPALVIGAPAEPALVAAAPSRPAPAMSASAVAAPTIGAAFGLVAALCYGVGGFMIGRYTQSLGWLVPVVVARGGAMVLLLGLLATPLRGPAGARLAPGLSWALAAGLADAAGLVCFARGGQVLIFRERLMRQQVGGALLILVGLIMVGLG